MAMFRPGAIAALIISTGNDIGDASGDKITMLARSVVIEASVNVRDVTADGNTTTKLVNNGLVGGVMRIAGWVNSGQPLGIATLQGTTLTEITITIIPTATDADRILVECTVESIRVAYEKTSVGVAVSLSCRISNVTADS